eukprot:3843433-Pleurochrysis_carterae.AAC.1
MNEALAGAIAKGQQRSRAAVARTHSQVTVEGGRITDGPALSPAIRALIDEARREPAAFASLPAQFGAGDGRRRRRGSDAGEGAQATSAADTANRASAQGSTGSAGGGSRDTDRGAFSAGRVRGARAGVVRASRRSGGSAAQAGAGRRRAGPGGAHRGGVAAGDAG